MVELALLRLWCVTLGAMSGVQAFGVRLERVAPTRVSAVVGPCGGCVGRGPAFPRQPLSAATSVLQGIAHRSTLLALAQSWSIILGPHPSDRQHLGAQIQNK